MLDDLKISLPLYEGPLDLLLDLIRGQKLDVYDIPIAKITEQYLEYLHLMEELDVDVASELLVVFRDVLKRAEQRPLIQVDRDEFSVEQMMAFLFEKIVAAPAGVALSEILPEIASRRALITAFLALLELTRLHAIYIKQNSAFGEITARANPNYELSKSFSPA